MRMKEIARQQGRNFKVPCMGCVDEITKLSPLRKIKPRSKLKYELIKPKFLFKPYHNYIPKVDAQNNGNNAHFENNNIKEKTEKNENKNIEGPNYMDYG